MSCPKCLPAPSVILPPKGMTVLRIRTGNKSVSGSVAVDSDEKTIVPPPGGDITNIKYTRTGGSFSIDGEIKWLEANRWIGANGGADSPINYELDGLPNQTSLLGTLDEEITSSGTGILGPFTNTTNETINVYGRWSITVLPDQSSSSEVAVKFEFVIDSPRYYDGTYPEPSEQTYKLPILSAYVLPEPGHAIGGRAYSRLVGQ